MNSFPTSRFASAALHLSLLFILAMPYASVAAEPIKETTANAPTAVEGGGNVEPVQFVPLTQLPGIKDAANASTLPSFLNTLYKICIGAGAVLAVIMIMVAGVEFMTSGGSFATNQKAKSRLQNALLGLLLVLSPTIVFGIINPSILNLDFTSDLEKLQSVQGLEKLSGNTAGQFQGADTYLWESSSLNSAVDIDRCKASGGTLSYECRKKNESGGHEIAFTGICASDENRYNVCKGSGPQPTSQTQCTAQYESITSVPITTYNKCSTFNGYSSLPHGCCTGASAAGNLCCGLPKNAPQYLYAAYYTKQTKGVENKCFVALVRKKVSAEACALDQAEFKNQLAAQERTTTTYSAMTILKNCEAVPTDTTFVIDHPEGLNACIK